MRHARLVLLALSTVLALSACASEPAAWTYAPAPSKTPPPSADASAAPSEAASGNIAITAARGQVRRRPRSTSRPPAAFKIDFDNQDAGTPHDIVIHKGDLNGEVVFKGEQFNGVEVAGLRRPGPRGRHLRLRLLDPPDAHDRGDEREVTPAGEQLCYTDAYARRVEARVAEVADGDAAAGRPRSDRRSIRAAAGSRRTAASSCGPPTGGPGRSGRRARSAARSPTSSSRPRTARHRSATSSRSDVEWARRLALMRTHTALHALCGVVWRDYGALVTGGNMEPGSGRMDFEFERMSGDLVDAIEATVNAELAAQRDVRVAVLPRDEAFAIPDLIRTKINLLPPGIEEIRTIEIVGLDLQADGGTHVANTREVGGIRVTGYESKGRINKRIRIELVDA